jgi:subtilisin family serine protease
MVGPIPMGSTLAAQKASNVVSSGYIQLSGTSFAAPIVSGIAAQVLARHPEFTSDQVKGVLMETTRATPLAAKGSTGLGEVNAVRAILVDRPPNPNKALDKYVTADPAGGSMFDGATWSAAAQSDVSWDAVSWGDVSWGDSAIAAVSWGDVAWDDVSWADGLTSSDVSWADVSWGDSSYEDAAEGDTSADASAYLTDPTDAATVDSEPDLQLPADMVGPDPTVDPTTP